MGVFVYWQASIRWGKLFIVHTLDMSHFGEGVGRWMICGEVSHLARTGKIPGLDAYDLVVKIELKSFDDSFYIHLNLVGPWSPILASLSFK